MAGDLFVCQERAEAAGWDGRMPAAAKKRRKAPDSEGELSCYAKSMAVGRGPYMREIPCFCPLLRHVCSA